MKFARLEHIRYLLNGGSAGYIFIHHYYFNLNQCTITISCKVGAGLLDLANKAEIQLFMHGRKVVAKESTKLIYKPGVLRKVQTARTRHISGSFID